MPNFKNEAGVVKSFSKSEVGMKRSMVIDGMTWKRIPRPKQLSRRERLSDQISSYYKVIEAYESLIGYIEELDLTVETFTPDQLEHVQTIIATLETDVDFGEIECLRDEIENWKSGMEGTNLEMSSKYEELTECLDYLESGLGCLESLSFDAEIDTETSPDELKDRLTGFVDELQSAMDELENVSFPGMY